MAWQDVVFTVGSLIFSVALVPSVLSKDKPALSTSLSTGVVLAVYAFTFTTLNLWFSTISVSITCIMWLTLAFQKYKQIKVGQE